MSSYSCWRSSGSSLIATRCSANHSLGQLVRLAVDLLAHLLDGGERGGRHVRLAQPVVVGLVVRAGEVVDVRLRDVGAERLLGVLEADSDRAVVGPLDELGVGQPVLAERPEIALTATAQTSSMAASSLSE